MLVVPETRIERAKYPVIDLHSHICGIGLPDGILKKIYHNNAARLLGLKQI
jgi:predicted TIM-barrel fold metal-dependent hydrolase